MVQCYICDIYGILSCKEVGDTIFGVAMQAIRGGVFRGRKGWFSLCNTAVLRLDCKSYWVL